MKLLHRAWNWLNDDVDQRHKDRCPAASSYVAGVNARSRRRNMDAYPDVVRFLESLGCDPACVDDVLQEHFYHESTAGRVEEMKRDGTWEEQSEFWKTRLEEEAATTEIEVDYNALLNDIYEMHRRYYLDDGKLRWEWITCHEKAIAP